MTTLDPGLEPLAVPEHRGLPKDPRIGFSVLLVLAQFFVMFASLTPVVVGLSVKLTTLLPPEQVAGAQGLVGGLTALLAFVATPIMGNLSDRTRSRFGRRRPWLVGGALVGIVGLAITAAGTSVPLVLLGSVIGAIGLNAAAAAVYGLYADRVPEARRGRVGGFIGVATNFGAIAGAAIATALSFSLLLTFVVPGVLALIALIALAAVARDSKDDVTQVGRFSVVDVARSFSWPVRTAKAFTINLISRFLIWSGYTAIIVFQALYFIQHFGIAPQAVAGYLLAATGLGGVATLIGSVASGWITDRVGRHRAFVIFAGVVLGAGLIVYATSPTVEAAIAAGVIVGLGLGIYLAVDLALAVRLVPDARFTGRYMAIVQLAGNLPQSIVPFVAPALLAVGAAQAGPNFLLLFLVAGIVSVVGALVMLLMRRP